MKILIVTQYFWPENFRINDLATALRDKGHHIEILTGIPNYPSGRIFGGYRIWGKKKEHFNGISIHRVPLMPRGNGGGVHLFLNYMSFVVFTSLLGPFFCREKVDRILVYEPSPVTVCLPAIILKWVKDAPILFWVQDLWPETLSATGAVKSKITLKIVGILVQFIYRQCDLILVQSRAFVSSIKRFGITQERIAYFPNSAEQFYRPVSPDTCSALKNKMCDGFRIMFAGNIGTAQDFKTILDTVEILKANKQIQWIVLGDGRMRPWVEKQINARGLEPNIKLLGRYPAEEMPKYFSHADALLVTLKKDPIFALTIPAKVQSYLACAKPIIAAIDGEGASIIIEAGAGLVCPSEDPQQLATAVMRLHNMSKDERDKMGQSGRKYFEKHFERNMLVDRFEKMLNHLPRENFKCGL